MQKNTRQLPCLVTENDLLPADIFGHLTEVLKWVPMYFLNRTDRDPAAHPLDTYWYYPLLVVEDRYIDDARDQLDELDPSLSVVKDIWTIVESAIGSPVRLYECELTVNGYGNEGHPHNDETREDVRSQHITAIVYCNADWKIEWAGETVLFDENGDVLTAVLPKPKRVAYIHGDPLHVARGVSRICPYPRRVLVFKMWKLANETS